MLKQRALFTDLTGWTITGGTATATGTNVWQGTASTVLTASAGNLYARKGDIFTAIDCASNNAYIRIVYYLPADQGTTTDINVYLYSGGNLANSTSITVSHRASAAADYRATAGWHWQELKVPATGSGAYNPNAITGVGFQVAGVNNNGVAIEVDSIEIHTAAGELPTFMFTFDDGYAEHYTAANIIKSHGWRGIFAVIPSGASAIGAAGAMTLANCQALDADGHLIVSHTYDHTAWDALTTAQKEREIESARVWLLQNGLTRGADILTFPNGFVGTQAELDMVMSRCRFVLNTSVMFPPRYNATAASTTPQFLPLRDRHCIARGAISDNTATTPFTSARIDTLIALGQGLYPIMIHQLSGAANRLTEQQFTDACTYLAAKEAAGLCTVVSDPEAWLAYGATYAIAKQLATDQTTAAGELLAQKTQIRGTVTVNGQAQAGTIIHNIGADGE